MRISLFVAFLVSVLLLSQGCSRKEQSATLSPSPKNIAEVTTVQARPGMAPNFSWKEKSGNTIDFDSFKGTVTLINFWATWCGPCKAELPDLIALQKEYADKNLRIIGISKDQGLDVLDEVADFVRDHGITYQILLSTSELDEAFGNIDAIPTSFIIDKNGKIAASFVGIRSKEALAEAINPLLN